LWKCHSIPQNVPCGVKSASKGPLDTIISQRYLQKLQNEVILVIQEAGHVDITFFQQDGACPHAANVILDILHDVFGSRVLWNLFPDCLGCVGCGWSWQPCSLDNILCNYFLCDYVKDHVYCTTNLHAVQELQTEIEEITEIKADMLHDTAENFVVHLR
jgi:hypothetical protein